MAQKRHQLIQTRQDQINYFESLKCDENKLFLFYIMYTILFVIKLDNITIFFIRPPYKVMTEQQGNFVV